MGGCVSVGIQCDKALDQAGGCLFGDGNYIHTMEANLEALEIDMQELREKQADLLSRVSVEEDKGLQPLSQVQGWFSRVKDIDCQVSVLLKAKPTETKRLCLFAYCSKKCISSCKYGRKVSKKLEEVKELKSRVFEEVAKKGPVPKVKEEDIRTETMVGLDSMVEKAWNSLMKGEHTKTLGLYGMGGVGKTTLLARINNKFLEEVNEFDVVIWVVVSKDYQNESIQNQILGRLRYDKEWKEETEEEKASSIYNILSRKKKFVLLLDDLWSEVDLKKIGVPHPTSDNGAKIVFTTRSKEVCGDMKADDELKVECLSPDEAWELFQKIVGEVALNRHGHIPKLAREIAGKCYGLPLALNVIGKAMAHKENVQEWDYAVKVLNSSSQKFPGMKKKIYSILKFSYDGLEDENFRSCFLYCSLFPEDYEIKKEELIEFWICEGFINGNRDEGHAINVKDAMILESIQGMERLASCVQRLFIYRMSAQVVTLNTVALGGLRQLRIVRSKISEIKIDWESKEKEELLSPTSPCFNHLSTVSISGLKGPKDLTWLLLAPNLKNLTVSLSPNIEEIINREKGMSISNMHPDISVPFQKLEFLGLHFLDELQRICSNPPSLPKLREFVVQRCRKLPKAATLFTSASGSNDMTIIDDREGDE